MLNRRKVLEQAIHDCFKEMYAKSQPPADWDKIVDEFKTGVREKDERVYEQHYLSKDEFTYILDKYIEAYNIKSHWKEDVEIIENYLKNGGLKDVYISAQYDDNGDIISPGYRSAEKVPAITDQITNIVPGDAGKTISELVLNNIINCKNFYKFDQEENSFRFNISLGASPTSNPDTVKKYWKEKTGEDIQIEERNPKLFWYIDAGYTDEDLEYEFDDPNWKENLKNEWENELLKRKNNK